MLGMFCITTVHCLSAAIMFVYDTSKQEAAVLTLWFCPVQGYLHELTQEQDLGDDAYPPSVCKPLQHLRCV